MIGDQEPSLELVMPFVTVASMGGPHDDDSYAAGWQMGQLDAHLSVAGFHMMQPYPLVISHANLPQAELIAMKHGFTMRDAKMDDDMPEVVREEWMTMLFEREVDDGLND